MFLNQLQPYNQSLQPEFSQMPVKSYVWKPGRDLFWLGELHI